MDNIPNWHRFTVSGPTLPDFYWNVKSQEERMKKISENLWKLINMQGAIIDGLNEHEQEITDIQAEIEAILEALTGQGTDLTDLEARLTAVEQRLDNLDTDEVLNVSNVTGVTTTDALNNLKAKDDSMQTEIDALEVLVNNIPVESKVIFDGNGGVLTTAFQKIPTVASNVEVLGEALTWNTTDITVNEKGPLNINVTMNTNPSTAVARILTVEARNLGTVIKTSTVNVPATASQVTFNMDIILDDTLTYPYTIELYAKDSVGNTTYSNVYYRYTIDSSSGSIDVENITKFVKDGLKLLTPPTSGTFTVNELSQLNNSYVSFDALDSELIGISLDKNGVLFIEKFNDNEVNSLSVTNEDGVTYSYDMDGIDKSLPMVATRWFYKGKKDVLLDFPSGVLSSPITLDKNIIDMKYDYIKVIAKSLDDALEFEVRCEVYPDNPTPSYITGCFNAPASDSQTMYNFAFYALVTDGGDTLTPNGGNFAMRQAINPSGVTSTVYKITKIEGCYYDSVAR